MTLHDHLTFVPGCYRCELGRDEAIAALAEERDELQAESEWIWHGTAGHFIGASSCCFRLHTTVGRYRVSTVGCYHPASDPTGKPHEIGSGRLYETMVFENGPDGKPVDWSELDSDVYNDEAAAQAGHIAMCRKMGNA